MGPACPQELHLAIVLGRKGAAFRGLVAFPAPIVGGFLYQWWGHEAPLLASFVGTIVSMGIIMKFLPNEDTRQADLDPEASPES